MNNNTNFKYHQYYAIQSSNRLILMFILTVVVSLVGEAIVTTALFYLFSPLFPVYRNNFDINHINNLSMSILLVCGTCLLCIVFGCLARAREFKNMSGLDIALFLAGTQIIKPENLAQSRLLNIIEEISIASNIKMPAVLTSTDPSINAFVTGRRGDYAITVSEGALLHLNREELQAVIAHEFGHIVSKDTDLNMKLSIYMAGFYLAHEIKDGSLEVAKASAANVILVPFYYCLFVLTQLSLFFGYLFQAAISRQREYLADAYSVNFTRNSQALINALKKCEAQHLNPQQVTTNIDQSFAHFLFFNYQNKRFNTHPSIAERIKKYGGLISNAQLNKMQLTMESQVENNRNKQIVETRPDALLLQELIPLVFVNQVLAKVKMPESLDFKSQNAKPDIWVYALFCFLQNANFADLKELLPELSSSEETMFVNTQQFLGQQHPLTWMKYLEEVLPYFQTASQTDKLALLNNIGKIIRLDNKLEHNELSYLLAVQYSLIRPAKGMLTSKVLQSELNLLVRALIMFGSGTVKSKTEILQHTLAQLNQASENISYSDLSDDWTSTLYRAAHKFSQLSPECAASLLDVLENIVQFNQSTTIAQYNLGRAFTKILLLQTVYLDNASHTITLTNSPKCL